MSKIQKKLSKQKIFLIVAAIVFLFSVIKIGITLASTDSFAITSAEVYKKSSTVDVNNFSFEKCKITKDITFHKVGDSVVYKIKIKNNEDVNYTIKSISNDNENQNISYTHDGYEGTKLNSKEEITIEITEKYVQENDEVSKRNQKFSFNLIFTLEDEEGNIIETTIPMNSSAPKTGDNIGTYIAIAGISLVLMILLNKGRTFSLKKNTSARSGQHGRHGTKGFKLFSLFVVGILILPTISKAATNNALTISFENNIALKDKLIVSYGWGNETHEIVVGYDETITGIENPEVEGYRFDGWILEDGTEFDINTPVTDDIKITANLVYIPKNYSVILNANGGVGNDIVIPFVENEAQTLPDNTFTRTGFVFKGWNILADGQGEHYDNQAEIINLTTEDEIILYAEWEEKIAIFEEGYSVNTFMKQLTGQDNAYYLTRNNSIKSVKRSMEEPNLSELNEYKNVASQSSEYPIYMWFDSDTGTIYFWTEAYKPMLNVGADAFFYNCRKLESVDLDEFNTSQTKSFSQMFNGCNSIKNIDIEHWDFSNATSTSAMFYECTVAQTIKLPTTTNNNLKNVQRMFAICSNLESIDISKFDFKNAENVSEMFSHCKSLVTVDFSQVKLNKATNMNGMFKECAALKSIDMSKVNATNVQTIDNMFWSDSALESVNLNGITSNNLTSMGFIFSNCSKLKNVEITALKTQNVTNFGQLFLRCGELEEVDISNLDTQNATRIDAVFQSCTKLKTVYASDKFVFDSNASSIFYGCTELVGGMGTTYVFSGAYVRIDGGPSNPGLFTDKNILNIDFDANGGIGEMGMQTMNRYNPDALTANSFTESTGKTFAGWNTKADGTGTHFEDRDVLSNWTGAGYIKLYAEWEL